MSGDDVDEALNLAADVVEGILVLLRKQQQTNRTMAARLDLLERQQETTRSDRRGRAR